MSYFDILIYCVAGLLFLTSMFFAMSACYHHGRASAFKQVHRWADEDKNNGASS